MMFSSRYHVVCTTLEGRSNRKGYIYIYVICDLLDEAQLGHHIFRLKAFPFQWSTAPSSVDTLRD